MQGEKTWLLADWMFHKEKDDWRPVCVSYWFLLNQNINRCLMATNKIIFILCLEILV